ncbi:MAG: hypothetical protein WBD20_24275 [Pirellulaceae bacterium]
MQKQESITDRIVTPRSNRRIFVLPRLKIRTNIVDGDKFGLSKAVFLPDEDAIWAELLEQKRPTWLDIFREFPYLPDESAEPARGTLIVSDDDEWLTTHIDRLLGIVFSLNAFENQWRGPTEAFRYSSFVAPDEPGDCVSFRSKTGRYIESSDGLQLLPPLELRGPKPRISIDPSRDWSAELILRFDLNPYDRLATACFHLMRSQFQDFFTSSREQDAASICACLEAAFDLPERGISDELVEKLTKSYFDDEKFQEWIRGLYGERSVFNHGAKSDAVNNSGDPRAEAIRYFRQRTGSWDLARNLALDVIRRQCQESAQARNLQRGWSEADDLLSLFFRSNERWGAFRKEVVGTKPTDRILALEGQPRIDFIKVCLEFVQRHDWQMMDDAVNHETVWKAIQTMAAVFGKENEDPSRNEKDPEGLRVYEAAEDRNVEKMNAWYSDSIRHRIGVPPTLGSVCKAAALHLTEIFLDPDTWRKRGGGASL